MNTTNLRNSDLRGHNNTVIRLSNDKQSNSTSTTNIKTSRDKSNCSVSISEESKAMFKQLLEERKQHEPNLISKDKNPTVDSDSLEIRKEPKKPICVMDDTAITYECGFVSKIGAYKYRLLSSAYQVENSEKARQLNFGTLASDYAELEKIINSKYTGEELEERLNLLNSDYDEVLSEIAYTIKLSIALYGESAGEKRIAAAISRNEMNDMNKILAELGIDESQPLTDSIDAIVKFLAQKAREAHEQKIEL